MDKKYVYLFKEATSDMRNLLGGKGVNLAQMLKLGLPVPQGFVVSTEACTKYYQDGGKISEDIKKQIFEGIRFLEKENSKFFGDENNPLLVSVRSGARVSMPGMMNTILNIGLNDKTTEGFAKVANPRLAYDSYRRFIQMFSNVVMDLPMENFERLIEAKKKDRGVVLDRDLEVDALKELILEYKQVYKITTGEEFLQDVNEQLLRATNAVFSSWQTPRAVVYRRLNDIPSSWGTAVNIQTMVFGNKNENSGTGVAFSRNPATGENLLYGEYLINAQGEDVVAGIRTPEPIAKLEKAYPHLYKEFESYCQILENHYRDMQDVEFTIDDGKLYMLQTRNGKRTAKAALKIAVDMVDEGLITKEEALLKIDPYQIDSLLHPQFEETALKSASIIAKGLPASPGASTGVVAFESKRALELKSEGKKVILVRLETSPEDIEGMYASEGVLTATGGMTSHAAVVARGMGRSCIVGCNQITINEKEKSFSANGEVFKEGDYISLDGSSGNVYKGIIKTVKASLDQDFKRVMSWAKQVKHLGVRANADTPTDAKQALDFGAEGIGLCRTEHMFFDGERITAVRQMILANTKEERQKALDKILPMQKEDFIELYKIMEGRPVTIRLLDPPLHEFLPHEQKDLQNLAKDLGVTFEVLKNKVESLRELNPMLGHRGVRLSITYPEIALMQTEAIIQAALEVKQKFGFDIKPEIMVPLIVDKKEYDYIKEQIKETADKLIKNSPVKINYQVGTMIEVPRAALVADKIATSAEFFSFGTNDLTQMTYGFSRDDAGKFLDDYYTKNIFEFDPFSRVDFEGVGKLIEMATTLGKGANPNLKIGICGEQGANPSTVEFCHKLGLDYVSCSPYRVPVCLLAAAQASLKSKK